MADDTAQHASFALALADAQQGGERGLTQLFRAFQPRVLRYLRAREPRMAQDIASDTWMAVATRIGSFEGDVGSFSAWIFTIARHRLADHRRTAARRRTDPVGDFVEWGATDSSEVTALDELAAQHAVDMIVRNLSDDQAEVVLLKVLGGLGTAEVAASMGRTEGWVRVTYHRAIHRLRDQLVTQDL